MIISIAIIGNIVFVSLLFTLLFTFILVKEKTVAIIERFGKFSRIKNPGLRVKIPFIDWVEKRVNLKVDQLDVKVSTKTKDNVFVDLEISVQNKVNPEKVYESYYLLDNPAQQIESYIFDSVRAIVPLMSLDEVFENKEKIASEIVKDLGEIMKQYGYDIVKALVTEIRPAQQVVDAMNRIEKARREKIAALEEGEAKKIMEVKNAEAEAISKKLQGEGIANQRLAIAEGFKKSIDEMKAGLGDNVEGQDIMNVLLMVQYFDTVKDIAASSHTNTLFMNSSPQGMSDLKEQITQGIVLGKKVTEGKN